jgi:protein-disulfide isomerase
MNKHRPAPVDTRRAQLRAAQIVQAKRQKNQRIAIVAVSAVVAIALLFVLVLVANRFNAAKVEAAPPNASAELTGILAHPGSAQPDAPVVSLFVDYQCPACANFERAYGSQLDQLAEEGAIQLEYRTMTFLDTNLGNDASTRAANAAACADLTGRYSEYHNTIFANQPSGEGTGYTDEQLTGDFAAQAGITGTQSEEFTTCYDERRFSGFVNSVDREAGRAGITGTPSLQVDGTALDLGTLTNDPNSLRDAIMNLK